jgi:hypothetical protein
MAGEKNLELRVKSRERERERDWIPACAGMTG